MAAERPPLTTRTGALLALLSGVALAFAFPEPDIAPLAWFAPAGLLLAARGVTFRRGLGLGLLFGLGFFGALLYWVSLVGWVAWAALVLLQAVLFALFGGAWAVASRIDNPIARVAAAPALWIVVEVLRQSVPVVGFPWGQLSQSQHNLEWMLRPARFGGGWVVAFIVVAVAALVGEAAVTRSLLRAGTCLATGAGIVLLPLLVPAAAASGEPMATAIVQGNVPRDFEGTVLEKDQVILRSHVRLTKELAGSGAALVVWPESSVGIDVDRDPAAAREVASAARSVGADMIIGANLDVDADRYTVDALHVSREGNIVERYQKTHLVPFGEYVPARSLIGGLPMLAQVPRDAVAAHEPTVFDIGGGEVAPVISFEGDFGSLVRGRIDAGGRLLVVATNTSTWGETWASAQHVAFSQVRAAENGVWVVHAALSGISAFIEPDGTVVDRTPLWTATSRTHEVRFATSASFYARSGDWFPLICAIASVALLLIGARRGRAA